MNIGIFERLKGDAAVVFKTSGSTGAPKHVVCNLTKMCQYALDNPTKPMRTLSYLRLDHIGGINTILRTAASAGKIYYPKSRDVETVCETIEMEKIECLPVNPSFLQLLRANKTYERYDLSSVKLITYGSESMPQSLLDWCVKQFPWAKFKQTYGLTETGILPTRSKEHGSLWMKVGGNGFETRIVDGMLEVRSHHNFMVGYLAEPDPWDDDGWFATGDRVEVDGEWIKILGRDSEMISVGGEKVYPQEVENIILQIDGVRDCVCYGEINPILGAVVATRIVRDDRVSSLSEAGLRRTIVESCSLSLKKYQVPMRIAIVSEIDYLENGKKNRKLFAKSNQKPCS